MAQDPPKIVTPIPSTVQPGAIEAQYTDDKPPALEGIPVVLSPYEVAQPDNADAIRFVLTAVEVDGGGTIPRAKIEPFYADKIGEEVPLSAVFAIARKITNLYVEEGYPLSLAYVPVQEIDDGRVRIRILEGFIGEIDVTGASPKTETLLRAHGEKLKAVRPLTQSALERYLLLANQISGVKTTGVLERSGNADGGVKLTLKSERKRFSLAGGVNNRASTAVGREQFYVRAGINGVLTGRDTLNFAAVQSFEFDELTYISGNYATVLNAEGLTLGLEASRSLAAPGIPFLRDLGFETEGWTAGASLSYPLIVRRGENLSVSARSKWKEFRSVFGVAPNTFDRLWTSEFSVAYQDETRYNGKTNIRLALNKGWDILGATRAGDPLASRNGGGGEFISFTADLSRNQAITDWLGALALIKAQTTNKPLLSSEQCGFGGAGIGRGYDPYTISGDQCLNFLLELQSTPKFLDFGNLKVRPYASFDAGAVRQNGVLAVGEERTASLHSIAAGARLALGRHVSAGIEGALPLKRSGPAAERDARFFFSVELRY